MKLETGSWWCTRTDRGRSPQLPHEPRALSPWADGPSRPWEYRRSLKLTPPTLLREMDTIRTALPQEVVLAEAPDVGRRAISVFDHTDLPSEATSSVEPIRIKSSLNRSLSLNGPDRIRPVSEANPSLVGRGRRRRDFSTLSQTSSEDLRGRCSLVATLLPTALASGVTGNGRLVQTTTSSGLRHSGARHVLVDVFPPGAMTLAAMTSPVKG